MIRKARAQYLGPFSFAAYHCSPICREAFTLLEVLLASVIAVVLLGGLYMMFDLTLRQTEEARDTVATSNLARNVFNRMAMDLSCALAPLPPRSGGNDTGSVAAQAQTTASTQVTDNSTNSTNPSSSTTNSGTNAGEGTENLEGTTGLEADLPLQGGVYGTESQLTVFTSQVPYALGDQNIFSQLLAGNAVDLTYSDLVKVTYWLSSSGQGLCRQEQRAITADGVRNTMDPDRTHEILDVIADDVTGLSFEYFHPDQGWVSSWDGSSYGSDGVTPLGPPRAVRVTLTFSIPSSRPNQPPIEKVVRQVIPIRTAPGSSTPTPVDSTSTLETGGGM